MAKKEEISKAELYRKERKERLAKEAKKNAKRNAKVARMKRVAIRTVAIVVAAAIVIGAAVAIVNSTGSSVFKLSVAKAGDTKISTTELQYYYRTSHAQLVNQATQYDQYYGEGYYANNQGFDYTKLPEEQKFPNEMLEGQGIDEEFANWDEYITYSTFDSLQYFNALAQEAEKNGVELTEDEIKAIDDQIEELRKTATENGRTLNAYLRASYGSGVNENNVKKWTIRDTLAQKYAEQKQIEFTNSFTAKDIDEEFKENINDYTYADFRCYVFDVETDDVKDGASESEVKAATEKAQKKAKKEAEDFLSKIKTEKQFLTAAEALDKANAANDKDSSADLSTDETTLLEKVMYSSFSSSFSEDDADWAFSSDRKTGDKKVFELKTNDEITNYYAIFVVAPAYKDETVASNIKAYTFSYEEDADKDSKAQTKDKAQALVDEWNELPADEKTAEEFDHIASHVYPEEAEKITSTDYDSYADGTLSEEVDKWVNNAKRKAGDIAVIESSDSCYVVYYSSKNEETNWQISVREALGTEAFEDYVEELSDKEEYALDKSGALKSFALKMQKRKLKGDLEDYLYQIEKSKNSQTATY